jgi:hypothetical protein
MTDDLGTLLHSAADETQPMLRSAAEARRGGTMRRTRRRVGVTVSAALVVAAVAVAAGSQLTGGETRTLTPAEPRPTLQASNTPGPTASSTPSTEEITPSDNQPSALVTTLQRGAFLAPGEVRPQGRWTAFTETSGSYVWYNIPCYPDPGPQSVDPTKHPVYQPDDVWVHSFQPTNKVGQPGPTPRVVENLADFGSAGAAAVPMKWLRQHGSGCPYPSLTDAPPSEYRFTWHGSIPVDSATAYWVSVTQYDCSAEGGGTSCGKVDFSADLVMMRVRNIVAQLRLEDDGHVVNQAAIQEMTQTAAARLVTRYGRV